MNNQKQPASPEASQGGSASSADKQPTVPEITPEQEPKPKLKLPTWASILGIVIAAIIVVGLVAWGGYELFKPSPSKLPEGGDVEKEDEFKDWKTYRNEEYGWEVQYPGDWTTRKLFISGETKDNVTILSGGKISDAATSPEKSVSITIVNNPLAMSIEEKVNQDCRKQPEGWCSYYQNPKEMLIGGVRALKYEDIPGELSYTSVYLSRNSQFVIIGTNNFVLEETFNQILSTFKFLEPDITANWKTYQNEAYGWEVQYPEDWILNESPGFLNGIAFKPSKGSTSDRIEIRLQDNPNDLDERDWIKEKEGNRYSMLMQQSEDIKVDTETGLLIKDQPEMVSYRIVYVSKDKKMYQISIAKNSSYVETFNQILSTFKFLE